MYGTVCEDAVHRSKHSAQMRCYYSILAVLAAATPLTRCWHLSSRVRVPCVTMCVCVCVRATVQPPYYRPSVSNRCKHDQAER